jgi:CRP-like cAMP-binding protein
LLLRSLGPALEALRAHLAPATFKAGQVIKHEGGPFDRVYFPTQGLISSRAVLSSGHQIECALIGNTNALGIIAAFGFDHEPARFVCLTDGHALTIALPQLAAVARAEPEVERQLNLFCFAQLGYAALAGVCSAMHTSDQRLARWLTTASELLGYSELRLAQEELASVLGLQRSIVNPALQRLKAEQLIELARGRIIIRDADRLGRRACECRSTLRRALCVDQEFPHRRSF